MNFLTDNSTSLGKGQANVYVDPYAWKDPYKIAEKDIEEVVNQQIGSKHSEQSSLTEKKEQNSLKLHNVLNSDELNNVIDIWEAGTSADKTQKSLNLDALDKAESALLAQTKTNDKNLFKKFIDKSKAIGSEAAMYGSIMLAVLLTVLAAKEKVSQQDVLAKLITPDKIVRPILILGDNDNDTDNVVGDIKKNLSDGEKAAKSLSEYYKKSSERHAKKQEEARINKEKANEVMLKARAEKEAALDKVQAIKDTITIILKSRKKLGALQLYKITKPFFYNEKTIKGKTFLDKLNGKNLQKSIEELVVGVRDSDFNIKVKKQLLIYIFKKVRKEYKAQAITKAQFSAIIREMKNALKFLSKIAMK